MRGELVDRIGYRCKTPFERLVGSFIKRICLYINGGIPVVKLSARLTDVHHLVLHGQEVSRLTVPRHRSPLGVAPYQGSDRYGTASIAKRSHIDKRR